MGNYFFSGLIETSLTPAKQKVRRGTMLYPRTTAEGMGILGWTCIQNGKPANPNDQEFDLIIKRARNFFYGSEKTNKLA